MQSSAKDISKALAKRVESVANYLFPSGKIVGKEFHVGSISGEPGQSLSICLKGDKSGVFCDFATGDSGDLLDLMGFKTQYRSLCGDF